MIDLAALDDVKNGSTLRVDVDGHSLCLLNIEDTIYILDDRCTHADFSLSEGTVDIDAKEIECPKHGALFDVTTGQPRCLPATKSVGTYKVVVSNGRIFLDEESIDA